MNRALGWLVSFLFGLALTLALSNPGDFRLTLVLYPPVFVGTALGLVFIQPRIKAWRDRRRAKRVWREFQARNLVFFQRPEDRRQPDRRS